LTQPRPGLDLVATMMPSGVDSRRGIVRLSAAALAEIGGQAWSVVQLTAGRHTGALAALSPFDSHQIWMDELILGNVGAAPGDTVHVDVVPSVAADRVVLTAPAQLMSAVPWQTARLALLGKVVSKGDAISLLQQDYVLPEHVTEKLLDEARRQLLALLGPSWQSAVLTVVDAPAVPAVVTMSTVVSWAQTRPTTGVPPGSAPAAGARPGSADTPLAMSELAGAEKPAADLQRLLDVGLNHPDLLDRLGTDVSLGVLLSGPPGSGKVTLVYAVAAAVGAQVRRVSAPALAAMPGAEAAQQLSSMQPPTVPARTVLLVEDVDAIAPADDDSALAAPFIDTVHTILSAGNAVVCTTSSPQNVSRRLVCPDVVAHELAIPLPDQDDRQRLLGSLTVRLPLADHVSLEEIAARTPGFVAADLDALVRAAGLHAADRERTTPSSAPTVTSADFDAALETVHPSAMGGELLDPGDVSLDDVGGLAEVKQTLTETVIWPITHPETFARMGISPTRGVLLYGPPGCGKTYLVKALAHDGRANVLSVKGAELLSKWVGESESAVRQLFARARGAAPSLIFLDEIDALAPVRGPDNDEVTGRVVAALLTELDGLEELHGVVVVAATNRPDMVDPALLRPGRLEQLVFVPPPDADARADIMAVAGAHTPLARGVDLRAVAVGCEGFSGADCVALVRQAALSAMRRSLDDPAVTGDDVEAALRAVRPSLDPRQVDALRNYAAAREKW
jgi:transitional endoplasmic reticulum ATPase